MKKTQSFFPFVVYVSAVDASDFPIFVESMHEDGAGSD